MPRPSAVVFDLGKVLLDFDYEKVAVNLLQYCKISREELTAALNQSALLHQYETGLLTTAAFFSEVKRVSQFCGELEVFEAIFADIFTPIPEMIDLHARLRSSAVPTYIFSNTNEIAVKHIRATYPFFRTFSGYIYSYEHRSMKPAPAIYSAVEELTGKQGADLLYIDDRAENIEQGIARGWQVIHHSSPLETIPEVEKLLL
ncbi:MAG TPA: HAD family phosphatase [Verrucomicrobiae bacterium]|nr:HAD family phosphatase [Verrucomicrobiae bacterium]